MTSPEDRRRELEYSGSLSLLRVRSSSARSTSITSGSRRRFLPERRAFVGIGGDASFSKSSITMGSDCGRCLLFEELQSTVFPSILLDDAICGVDAFSFPFFLLLLAPGAEVGGGGRAYNSVQRLAVRSCCALLRVYSVAIEGTKHGMSQFSYQRLILARLT